MVKLKLLLSLMFTLLIVGPVFAAPPQVTIQKDSGITIRETSEPNSKAVGAVYNYYTYPVLEAQLTYLKVKARSGNQGWVYVGGRHQLFKIKDRMATLALSYPLEVKADNESFFIKPEEQVELVGKWYSRIKIKAPGEIEGWIFAGSVDEPWIELEPSEKKKADFYVDLSSATGESNLNFETVKVDYLSDRQTHRFISSEESEIKLTLNIKKRPQVAKVILNHRVAEVEDQNPSSPISMIVNGKLVVQHLNPGGLDFSQDKLEISRYLNPGTNTIEIMLEEASAHYWLRKISIQVD